MPPQAIVMADDSMRALLAMLRPDAPSGPPACITWRFFESCRGQAFGHVMRQEKEKENLQGKHARKHAKSIPF